MALKLRKIADFVDLVGKLKCWSLGIAYYISYILQNAAIEVSVGAFATQMSESKLGSCQTLVAGTDMLGTHTGTSRPNEMNLEDLIKAACLA